MSELPNRDQIKKGMKVAIELKEDQSTGKLTEGIVKDILTASSFHPHGIKVELESEHVGRVKKLFSVVEDSEVLEKKLKKLSNKSWKLGNKISKLRSKLESKLESDMDSKEKSKMELLDVEHQEFVVSEEINKLGESLLKIHDEKLPPNKISKTDVSIHKTYNEKLPPSNKISKRNVSIPKKEDEHNEFKSTFQYDLKEENLRREGKIDAADARKNNYKKIREAIQKEISLTIAAFANFEGGRLFIGISDDSSILGLGRDLKEYENSSDKFQLRIKNSLKTFLQNNAFLAKLKFDFVDSKDKQYFVIHVPAATEPIFVITTTGEEAYVRMQNGSEKFSHPEFYRHCKDRFQN